MSFAKFTLSAVACGTLIFSCSQGSFTGGSSESNSGPNKNGTSNAGGSSPGGSGAAAAPGGTTGNGGPNSLGTTPVNSDGLSSNDGATNTTPTGKWYQADGQECTAFCATLKLTNVADPLNNAKCVAGEIRPANAITAGIKFSFGCWPDCSSIPDSYYTRGGGTFSVGNECYHPGEKQDHDSTDKTVGCFCQ